MRRMSYRRWIGVAALVAVTAVAAAAVGISMGWAVSPPASGMSPYLGDGKRGPQAMAWIPGQSFLMGTDSRLAQRNERPAYEVKTSGFWMDVHDVTNAEFARFVEATGYVTTAERKPRWEDLRVQLPPGARAPAAAALVPGAMVFVGTDVMVSLRDYAAWWRFVPGANWRHPHGPGSDLTGKGNHPVVQISYDDAQAYARWVGKRLPTEAQWEVAARGGLTQADYAWGDAKPRDGRKMANIWDDAARPFPVIESPKIQVGTSPVGQFAPNGYGLYDMAGNVWQWVADWYRADYFAMQAARGTGVDPVGPPGSFDPDDGATPVDAPKRVIRGGSFLCSDTYCSGYRTSARRGSDPFNPMSHIGFRLVMTPADCAATLEKTDVGSGARKLSCVPEVSSITRR